LSPGWLSPDDRRRALGYLADRFGIPEAAFRHHRLLLRGDHICAVREEACDAWDALVGILAGLKILKVSESGGLKPSSRGIQVFGRLATRNVWDLEEKGLRDLLEGRSLPYAGDRGYVILRCRGTVAGVALAREGLIVSQLPRSVTMYLRHPERGCSL
jgi:NOL1/NOP2/fmu family ribosome biogenesis protein